MADLYVPDLIEETSAGIFAKHAVRFSLPVLAAPTTADRITAGNCVRRSLVTIACANLKDYAFAFDSSFLAPGSADGFGSLAKLMTLFPGAPISIFGHADPDGDPTYNKYLSERRARAVFGLLLRRTAVWEQLYSDQAERQHVSGDVWGVGAIQQMLVALGFATDDPPGKFGSATKQAMAAFLDGHGGGPAENTVASRKALFAAYMDFLSPADPHDASQKWHLLPADFLAGASAPLGAPGDLQGCSAFNPQLIFAHQEEQDYHARGTDGKQDRHDANEPNRRVVIYLFEPTTTTPSTWPCPSAKAGIPGCKARFWSDADQRRHLQFETHRRRFGRAVPEDARRLTPDDPKAAARFGRAEMTFGCRFYHGVALHSPCERDLKMWVIRLWAGGPESPIANVRYVARAGTAADSPVVRGITGTSGVIGLPFFDATDTILLKVDSHDIVFKDLDPAGEFVIAPPDGATVAPLPVPGSTTSTDPDAWPDEDQFMTLLVDAGALVRVEARSDAASTSTYDGDEQPPVTPAEQHLGAVQRLRNLAFGGSELQTDDAAFKDAVQRFQLTFRDAKDATGELDDETVHQLEQRYGEQQPTEQPPT